MYNCKYSIGIKLLEHPQEEVLLKKKTFLVKKYYVSSAINR